MSKAKKPKPESTEAHEEDAVPFNWSRLAVHAAIGALFLAGCVAAVTHMREYVDRTAAAPKRPPAVVFKNRPAWMTDLVAKQLASSFQPAKAKSVFDHDVLVQTTRRLNSNPWVAKVNQVRRVYGKGPGDTIEIDCEFRAPIALVRNGFDFWFVDAQGVKLPERFHAVDVPKIVYTPDGRTNVRVIDGVQSPPPAKAGQKWEGEDLAAGLDMVRRLYGHSFTEDIVKVDVANFEGRHDPREAQLVFVTRENTQVRWGRPWEASDRFIEVLPERKMDNLRRIFVEFGRVDARQPWIDIRFDKITYPSPGAEPAAAQVDGSR